MKKLSAVYCLLLLLAAAAAGQPAVDTGGVVNAASYVLPGLPNHGIAQGSMFVIFGRNLGPVALRRAETFPYTTQLAGTSVRVTMENVARNAIMVYTSERQVAAILPSDTPAGDGTLTVTNPDNQTSAPAAIRVVRNGAGIFTRNQAGSGPAIAQIYNSAADQPLNSLVEAARPGQVIVLWATGLGPVDFDETKPPQVRNVDVDVEVLAGGKRAALLYKGRSPEFPGIDQINFQLPNDVPEGCYVPLVVRAGGVTSNFATISVSSQGKVCSDPAAGYTAAEIQKTQAAGEFRLGSILLWRIVVKGAGALDGAFASFDRYDHATMLKVLGIGSQPRALETGIPPFGTCNVLAGYNSSGDALGAARDPSFPTGLDAGPQLNLAGPRGSKQIKKRTDQLNLYGGYLAGTIPGLANLGTEFLVPGSYQVENGSGTSAVGPFTANLTLPAPPEWTNQDSINTISRSQDLEVTWSGGDAAREYVYVLGLSNDLSKGVSGAFLCTERISAGRLTIPAVVLSSLPASSTTSNGPAASLEVGSVPLQDAARFQAPGLDAAYFGYTAAYFKRPKFE